MEKSKLRVVTIVGTRPELIRLSRIISLFDKMFQHILIHTGQNYDYELNEIFFEDLGIREPDYFLDVDTTSFGTVIGETIIKSEKILRDIKPDALLVLGDTNSSLSAIVAKRLHIPVFHMEAGNRSFDLNVPEEINRRIVDHLSDYNLVYTSNSKHHLLSEGFPHRRIIITGSPMKEVIDFQRHKIDSSTVLNRMNLMPGEYFVLSVHREENVDIPSRLPKILEAINLISSYYGKRVIVSLHPRTRARIEKAGGFSFHENIIIMKPFSFSDYLRLQIDSFCTVSDSGTISEESAILGFPAVTIRNSMERPEALDHGSIILSGIEPNDVINAINLVTEQKNAGVRHAPPKEYIVPDVSWKVAGLIAGLAHNSNHWDGIYERE